MNTAALPYVPTQTKPVRNNPFLDALREIEYGRLTLTTPDGVVRNYEGYEDGPHANWQIYDWQVLDEFVGRGEFGFVDSYIDGRWNSTDVEALVRFGLLNTARLESFFHGRPLYALWQRFKNIFMRNSLSGSRRNVMAHYDLGNDFYKLWLDPSMTYSCGLFEGDESRTLEEAQAAKYNRILNKLQARPGQEILEIGCGWGGFAEAAAKRGLYVKAITLATTQAEYARARMRRLALDDLVSIELIDYRKVEGTYDHVVSIGMFEHVGGQYWDTYFETVKKRLKPGGRAIIQSITIDDDLFEELRHVTGFIEQYIFPGGLLPSKRRFREHAEKAGLSCKEIYGFGMDYAITLSRWLERFESQLDKVRMLGYDERFIRLWRIYLCSCIASFRSRRNDVMQVELTHEAVAATPADYAIAVGVEQIAA